MFNFKAKSLTRNNSEGSMSNRQNIINKLKSYKSLEEINKNSGISLALAHLEKIRFNLLTQNSYKISPIKVSNAKKQNLINNINTFRKIYGNYNRNLKQYLKDLNDPNKKNDKFIENYNNLFAKSVDNRNKIAFSDIKAQYEKQDYKLPKLENGNNLFKSNLLLSDNGTELKKYINYGLVTEKSNQKTLKYLDRLNEKIHNELLVDDNQVHDISIFKNLNNDENNNTNNIYKNRRYYIFSSLIALRKMSKEKLKEIRKDKKDIKKIKRTIDSINDIDYFFSSDNKEYLDYIKYFNSRNTSANFSTSLGNNNSLFSSKNKSNILNLRNISKISFEESEDKSNKIKNKKVKFKMELKTLNSAIQNKSEENKSHSKSHSKSNSKHKKKKKIKKYINRANYKKTLENLYNKISTSDNARIYDKKIRSYLKYRKFRLDPKINENNICNNMEALRDKICKDQSIKKVIDLRRSVGNYFKQTKIIDNKELEIEKRVNNIEDEMIKAFAELKN